jgi:hypothetical protein
VKKYRQGSRPVKSAASISTTELKHAARSLGIASRPVARIAAGHHAALFTLGLPTLNRALRLTRP